jgi:predicted RNA binding protein YcfA (HicA-like mRNA interferase family)
MVPKVPPLPYRKVYRLLLSQGFQPLRQVGSHVVFGHPDGRRTVVPRHARDVTPELLRRILKEAGIDPDAVRR